MTVGPPRRDNPGTLSLMSAISLTVPNALALRRGVAAAGALGTTLGAHAMATGDLGLTPFAPAAWLAIVATAVLLGGRHRWRARGVGGSVLLMSALQAVAHVGLSLAPWVAGLAPHHQHELALGPGAILAHAGAAVILALALARLERVLEAALHVVAAVRRRLARRAVRTPRPGRIRIPAAAVPHRPAPRVRACRGPPEPSPI